MYPLQDVRVIDFTQVLSGPFCTMLLADLGARVMKVERPLVGDETRRVRRFVGRGEGDEDYFYPMNRSKESVVIDLNTAGGQATARRLVETADVVVENFTPGTMDRWGLGYQDLRVNNPGLIYCSISGFGHTGPYRRRRAYDSIIQAFTGVMDITGLPAGPPVRSGLMFGDVCGSLYALSAILAALYARQRSGEGTWIDLALSDALLSLFASNAAEYLAIGRLPARVGAENPNRYPSGAFPCADHRYVVVLVGGDRAWAGLCDALGIGSYRDDPRFASNELRVRNRALLKPVLEKLFLKRPSHEWEAALLAAGVPCGRVNTLAEALADPQSLAREMLVEVDHPVSGRIRVLNHPFRFSSYPTRPPQAPPRLGEHTAAVLRELEQADD